MASASDITPMQVDQPAASAGSSPAMADLLASLDALPSQVANLPQSAQNALQPIIDNLSQALEEANVGPGSKQYVVLTGSPGVGKSSLINALVTESKTPCSILPAGGAANSLTMLPTHISRDDSADSYSMRIVALSATVWDQRMNICLNSLWDTLVENFPGAPNVATPLPGQVPSSVLQDDAIDEWLRVDQSLNIARAVYPVMSPHSVVDMKAFGMSVSPGNAREFVRSMLDSRQTPERLRRQNADGLNSTLAAGVPDAPVNLERTLTGLSLEQVQLLQRLLCSNYCTRPEILHLAAVGAAIRSSMPQEAVYQSLEGIAKELRPQSGVGARNGWDRRVQQMRADVKIGLTLRGTDAERLFPADVLNRWPTIKFIEIRVPGAQFGALPLGVVLVDTAGSQDAHQIVSPLAVAVESLPVAPARIWYLRPAPRVLATTWEGLSELGSALGGELARIRIVLTQTDRAENLDQFVVSNHIGRDIMRHLAKTGMTNPPTLQITFASVDQNAREIEELQDELRALVTAAEGSLRAVVASAASQALQHVELMKQIHQLSRSPSKLRRPDEESDPVEDLTARVHSLCVRARDQFRAIALTSVGLPLTDIPEDLLGAVQQLLSNSAPVSPATISNEQWDAFEELLTRELDAELENDVHASTLSAIIRRNGCHKTIRRVPDRPAETKTYDLRGVFGRVLNAIFPTYPLMRNAVNRLCEHATKTLIKLAEDVKLQRDGALNEIEKSLNHVHVLVDALRLSSMPELPIEQRSIIAARVPGHQRILNVDWNYELEFNLLLKNPWSALWAEIGNWRREHQGVDLSNFKAELVRLSKLKFQKSLSDLLRHQLMAANGESFLSRLETYFSTILSDYLERVEQAGSFEQESPQHHGSPYEAVQDRLKRMGGVLEERPNTNTLRRAWEAHQATFREDAKRTSDAAPQASASAAAMQVDSIGGKRPVDDVEHESSAAKRPKETPQDFVLLFRGVCILPQTAAVFSRPESGLRSALVAPIEELMNNNQYRQMSAFAIIEHQLRTAADDGKSPNAAIASDSKTSSELALARELRADMMACYRRGYDELWRNVVGDSQQQPSAGAPKSLSYYTTKTDLGRFRFVNQQLYSNNDVAFMKSFSAVASEIRRRSDLTSTPNIADMVDRQTALQSGKCSADRLKYLRLEAWSWMFDPKYRTPRHPHFDVLHANPCISLTRRVDHALRYAAGLKSYAQGSSKATVPALSYGRKGSGAQAHFEEKSAFLLPAEDEGKVIGMLMLFLVPQAAYQEAVRQGHCTEVVAEQKAGHMDIDVRIRNEEEISFYGYVDSDRHFAWPLKLLSLNLQNPTTLKAWKDFYNIDSDHDERFAELRGTIRALVILRASPYSKPAKIEQAEKRVREQLMRCLWHKVGHHIGIHEPGLDLPVF